MGALLGGGLLPPPAVRAQDPDERTPGEPTWSIPPPEPPTGPSRVLIGFHRRPGPAEEALVRQHGGSVRHRYHLIPYIAAEVPAPALAAALRTDPRVRSVEPDGLARLLDEVANSWGVDTIDAELVHPFNTGLGVKVAIIDTGAQYTHPDLDARFDGANKGYDFFNNDQDPADDNGHGTHVAGIVAAERGNTSEIVDPNGTAGGVVGVAPGARLYALKVLGSGGSGPWSGVIAALEWAVDHGVQVANMSLGDSSAPTALQEAIAAAYNAGMVLVAAAGNSGTCAGTGDNVTYPARYPEVIAVAATNSSDTSPCFSSTGPANELAAPGVSVRSAWPPNTFANASGTSMASPHVAGLAALVIASDLSDLGSAVEAEDLDCASGPADGAVNKADVRIRMQNTALDLVGGSPTGPGAGGGERDTWYGCGRVRANGAAPDPGPIRAVTSLQVTPGGTLTLDVGATQQLTATAAFADASTVVYTGLTTWSSSNVSVAKVGPNGLVTAVAPGTVTITGSWRGASDTVLVTVGVGPHRVYLPLVLKAYAGGW